MVAEDHHGALIDLLKAYRAPRVAEIGVAGGRLSAHLLKNHGGLFLYMIDPWAPYALHPHRDQAWWDYTLKVAEDRTEFAEDRREIVRLPSIQAAWGFPDKCLDLVFIDGNHRYEFVIADCVSWFPKVAKGGILCGHDILSRKNKLYWGVDRAVEWFSKRINRPFTIIETIWVMRCD